MNNNKITKKEYFELVMLLEKTLNQKYKESCFYQKYEIKKIRKNCFKGKGVTNENLINLIRKINNEFEQLKNTNNIYFKYHDRDQKIIEDNASILKYLTEENTKLKKENEFIKQENKSIKLDIEKKLSEHIKNIILKDFEPIDINLENKNILNLYNIKEAIEKCKIANEKAFIEFGKYYVRIKNEGNKQFHGWTTPEVDRKFEECYIYTYEGIDIYCEIDCIHHIRKDLKGQHLNAK